MSVTCRLTDEVIGYRDLAQRCKDICTDDRSLDVALMELCRQKRCVIGVGSDGEKVVTALLQIRIAPCTDSLTQIAVFQVKFLEGQKYIMFCFVKY